MKYTEIEAEKILRALVQSTRSPKGLYSAQSGYPKLHRKIWGMHKNMIGRKIVFRAIAIAAACALLFITIRGLYEFAMPSKMCTINTLAECKTIQLSDGSTVMLNHFSSLTYPERFKGKTREVTLLGEGYFEVAKNKEKAFIVNAQDIEVRVLGTHFNIEAYRNNAEIKTTLFEGAVLVSANNSEESIILEPNQSATYNKLDKELSMQYIQNPSDEIVWRQGYIIFNHLSLKEIMRELGNSYNVEIQITDSDLNNYHLTAKFSKNESLENILNLLQTGRNFSYKKVNNNKFIINKN